MPAKKVSFTNQKGVELAGILEFPLTSKPITFAVFSHAFTGSKNLTAARHIARALTLAGIAVLRFDFTGLGNSGGDFSETTFSDNIEDIKAAVMFLAENYSEPNILIGHSLGGAAAVFAASQIDSINAVATIGTPSEPEHVKHLFGYKIEDIEQKGFAEVKIGPKSYIIKKQFIDDLNSKKMYDVIREFGKAILILHSPQDNVVELENAAKIYHAAMHPKSFVTLEKADHMLSHKDDAFYAGTVIASWVKRYISLPEKSGLKSEKQVSVRLGAEGYTTEIMAGHHGMLADESEKLGGNDFGPSPYEILNAALGACTAMTLQMYARRKKWDLKEVKVHLAYNRSYKEDCEDCSESERRLDRFEKCIELEGNLDAEQIKRLLEIADRCPVHRTLQGNPTFDTSLFED